ncbi:hypothetical protein B0920_25150 [Massilia sp. KIM]|jgi:hypothetical protein|uniref:hypothetical protein n=1 Tax=Massilia sp. KIM TaxID=1955422 RepID=UPI00098EDDC7|nr:hypothetical protein [Massilia sp. KIM]OON59118.1 hypothetical protein B0920_25150 [Massilia sp. KIM]
MSKSKEKVRGGDNRAGGIHKPKVVTVAEGSLQSRAPGYVMPGGPDTPFQKAHTGSMQSENRGARGGPGAQQAGWSARQQAQRMQARGEQERLGEPQQSGGGNEQYQHAGSQESPTGPKGSLQSSDHAKPKVRPDEPASDFGKKRGGKNTGR